jgi:uncharacterized membrane protein (DUF485 family)
MLLTIWETEWMSYILMALALGISGLITYAFTLLNTWLSTKIKNAKVKEVLRLVTDTIQSVVQSIQQTFVSTLKANGKFDKEAQKEALAKAIEQIKLMVSEEAKALIEELYGDFETWITMQVESMVGVMFNHTENSVTIKTINE